MKTIVVAIDFSKGSLHALDYAINMANHFSADVHMIWVDNISTDELVYSHFSNKDRMELKKNFEDLIREKKQSLEGGKLSYTMKKGKVYIEIHKFALSLEADLIIAGTHGVSGYESHWIGSNAYRIVAHAPCPVITLRIDYECCDKINSILFPVDNSVESKQKLPFTVALAKAYNSKINLLGLYSTNLKSLQNRIDKHLETAEKYFKENGVIYETEKIKPGNATKFILDYAENKNVSLITIMTEQENTTDHVFLGQHAQQLINHSKRPVLSLKSKEIIKKQVVK